MKKLLLIFTLIFIALLGASMVSASTNADNLNAVELKNVDNVTIEPNAEDKNVGNVSIEPNEDDSNSVGNEINANEGMTNSSEIGKDFDGDSKSESNQTNIIKEKLASETNVSATKLDIKGPKIGVPLDIPGPKFSFDDLQAEINKAAAGSTLTLHCDYKGKENSRIQLNKDLTIEGNGYTIDCAGQSGCSAFYSNSGNIILKNLIIINGHNSDTEKGGAIYINGSAQYTIDHCTFKNNSGHFGSAINGNEIIITDSEFIGNQEGVIISHENISIDGKIISGENAFDNDFNKISLIRVSVSKFTTTYLSGKNIEIRLTFKDGKPVSRYDLILGITNGKKTKYYYESTNSKGVCNFESSNLNVGTYKLEIIGDYSPYSNIPKKTTTVKITKAKTIIKAPKVTNKYKKSKYFKVSIKNKATKKAVKNTYVKIKIDKKTYKIKTNSKGIAKINTKKLKIGKHKVTITSANANYQMSAKSTITIK